MKKIALAAVVLMAFASVADARCCGGLGNGFFARLFGRHRQADVSYAPAPQAAFSYRAANCACTNCQCGPQSYQAVPINAAAEEIETQEFRTVCTPTGCYSVPVSVPVTTKRGR